MLDGTLSRMTVAISLVAGATLILVPACSNNSKQAVQKNEDDQQDDQDDNDGGDDDLPDTGPVAMDAGGDTEGDGADRDAAADTTPRDASLDVTGRDVADDEQDSTDKKDSRNFSWEVREGCDVEKGPGDNPSCSEPSSCPGPDNAREPEVTCYNPQYTPAENNVTLHIYGKHLVKQGGPPREIAVRQAGSSGVGRSNGDITVHSDCHVSATLYLDDSFSSCGEKVEVRLVREQNLEQDGDTFQLEREASDWKEILLTQP